MDYVDTDLQPYDTGTFASTGVSVATLAVERTAQALRENLLDLASQISGAQPDQCDLQHGKVRCGARSLTLQELYAAAPLRSKLHVARKVYGSPRSTAFLAHGFRVAVHRVTGEIRILQSVHAYDAGKIINPVQARGQVEGAVAQGIGITLFERMVIDALGAVVNPTFRNYRIPAFADIPRSEVFFADTHDRYGPLGAKPLGEAPLIPVSPAMGNAITDATGIRFHSLPFSADRIFSRLAELQKDSHTP